MFAVTVAFNNMAWRLLYKDEDKAKGAFELIMSPVDKMTQFNPTECLMFTDDFGQRAFFRRSAIGAAMFENLDESKVASIEMAIHNAHTEAGARQRAESDPTLRAARVVNNRPGVISPMGPGFNN